MSTWIMGTWIRKGQRVRAAYLTDTIVVGTVVESRVKYGGTVQHTLVLDEPITFRWRSEPVTRLLVDEIGIQEVLA